jgi:hypothetical protein
MARVTYRAHLDRSHDGAASEEAMREAVERVVGEVEYAPGMVLIDPEFPTDEAAEKAAGKIRRALGERAVNLGIEVIVIKRGGHRDGAGRKPGTGKGRTVKTRSVSMPPAMWDRLDALRGDRSRGDWIAERVRKARVPANAIGEAQPPAK